jgi:hypothetical protein
MGAAAVDGLRKLPKCTMQVWRRSTNADSGRGGFPDPELTELHVEHQELHSIRA